MEEPAVPDLSRDAVLNWLRSDEPDKPYLTEGAATMHPDVEAALRRLGSALDTALARDPDALLRDLLAGPIREDMRAVLGQLDTPSILRLIGWMLREGLPQGDTVLAAILAADETGTGQFLQSVIVQANRPAPLARLFAPERLAALLDACQIGVKLREAV
jgi:hypothetical protein